MWLAGYALFILGLGILIGVGLATISVDYSAPPSPRVGPTPLESETAE